MRHTGYLKRPRGVTIHTKFTRETGLTSVVSTLRRTGLYMQRNLLVIGRTTATSETFAFKHRKLAYPQLRCKDQHQQLSSSVQWTYPNRRQNNSLLFAHTFGVLGRVRREHIPSQWPVNEAGQYTDADRRTTRLPYWRRQRVRFGSRVIVVLGRTGVNRILPGPNRIKLKINCMRLARIGLDDSFRAFD